MKIGAYHVPTIELTITVERLAEIIELRAGGELFWRVRPVPAGARDYELRSINRFNTLFAGKRALNSSDGCGYFAGKIMGHSTKAHRVVYALHNGRWPKGYIDHINRVRNDNRPENLREVTHSENCRNRSTSLRNKTGRTGVCFSSGKWVAQMTIDYQKYCLGWFDTFEEAAAARQAGEVILDHFLPMKVAA